MINNNYDAFKMNRNRSHSSVSEMTQLEVKVEKFATGNNDKLVTDKPLDSLVH